MENQSQQPAPIHDGNPYFLGDHALVRFSSGEDGLGPETYWLVDKNNRTIRPFESHMALDAAFGNDLEDALKHSVVVTHPIMDKSGNITEGSLSGFELLGPEYAIKEDGTSKPLHFSTHQLSRRYGKPVHEENEHLSTEVIDGFLKLLEKNDHHTQIPAQYITKLRDDPRLMAHYISAMAYGDYSLNDVYSDIKHRFHNKL